MSQRQRPAPSLRPALIASAALGLLFACGPGPDESTRAVATSIDRHGGDVFERSRIQFTFRDTRFEVVRDGGRFRYERSYPGPDGLMVREILHNDGVELWIGDRQAPLDAPERARIREAINSVVYFNFLPFHLNDPPVRLRDLGEDQIAGEPYHRIEVTFREEGGGDDWDDRFVHWIHRDDHTLDYFAYRYHRGEGGTRFRRAVNRREIGGVLVQDQENFRSVDPIGDIADYGQRFDEGSVELVSMVEMEDVRVEPLEDALE